jgi:hypothetical protein
MPRKIIPFTAPKPRLDWLGIVNRSYFAAAEKKLVPQTGYVITSSEKADVDPAVAALQSQMASENAKKAENT